MSTNLQVFDTSLSSSSIEDYIARAQQIPFLSAEEEQELAQRTFFQNDLNAAKRLILSHLRYVIRIARGFSGYGLALADLIQEGNVGLMKAVKRFNPDVGVRLASFAIHWIKAEIHEFVLRNWRIVKVATTKAQRKLFFNLRSAKKRLTWLNRQEREEIASDLGVSPKDVEVMESRLTSLDMPFDAPTTLDGDSFAPAEYLEDNSQNPHNLSSDDQLQEQHHLKLQGALQSLDQRSQDILQRRWLEDKKTTLQDLAAHYNVSAERIRQLEKAAMAKLKTAMVAA